MNPHLFAGCAGQFRIVSLLSFCRCFSAQLVGIGIPILILKYWTVREGSDLYSGLSMSIVALFYVFSTVFGGRISDRVGRKRTLVGALRATFGITLMDLTTVIILLSRLTPSSWLLLFIMITRALEGLITGFYWPVLAACIPDTGCFYGKGEKEQATLTTKGLGLYNLGWNAGMLCGSFLYAILAYENMVEVVLMCPVAIQAVNLYLMAFYKDCGILKTSKPKKQKGDRTLSVDDAVMKYRAVLPVVLGVLFVFTYAVFINWVYITTTNLVAFLGLAPLIGVFEALRITMQGISSFKVKPSNKHALARVFVLLAVMDAFIVVMAFFTKHVWLFLFLFPSLGFIMGLVYYDSLDMVTNAASSRGNEGFVLGIFEAMGSIGGFGGSLLAGFITQVSTFSASYAWGAGATALLIITCFVIYLSLNKAGRRKE
jgi:MFS family permease